MQCSKSFCEPWRDVAVQVWRVSTEKNIIIKTASNKTLLYGDWAGKKQINENERRRGQTQHNGFLNGCQTFQTNTHLFTNSTHSHSIAVSEPAQNCKNYIVLL